MTNPYMEQDEQIQSFSETPSVPETKEDLDAAEDENTEVQEKAEEENKPDDMPESGEKEDLGEENAEGVPDADSESDVSGSDTSGSDQSGTDEENGDSEGTDGDGDQGGVDTSDPDTSSGGEDDGEDPKSAQDRAELSALLSQPDDYSGFRKIDWSSLSSQLTYEEEVRQAGGDEGSELTEEELLQLPEVTQVTLRYISPNLPRTGTINPFDHPNMDYETPAGTDTPGDSCPSCEDAGDAAIIDAEVAPSEGSGEETGPLGGNSGSDSGGDFGGGDDLGGEGGEDDFGDFDMKTEIKYFTQVYRTQEYKEYRDVLLFGKMSDYYVPGMTDWATQGGEPIPRPIIWILKAYASLGIILLRITAKLMLKAAKYGRKVYLIARKHISNTFMKMETIYKLWKFKLGNHLDAVNSNDLDKEEVEAFPFNDWIEACKIGLATFDIVKRAGSLVFEKQDGELTAALTQYKEKLDKAGIQMDPAACKINTHEFMDRRKHDNVNALGFTKQNMPNAMRYFEEIAKRMDAKKKEVPLQNEINACIVRLGEETKQINAKIKSGELSQDSPEYKEVNKHMANYAIRLAFVTSCMELTYGLLTVLVQDIQRVLGAYENAFDPKFITHG